MKDETKKSNPSSKTAPFDFKAGEKAHDIIMSALDEIDSPATIDDAKKRELMSIVDEKRFTLGELDSNDVSPYELKEDSTFISKPENPESTSTVSPSAEIENIQTQTVGTTPTRSTSISDSTAQRVPSSDSSRARNNKYKELCRKPSMNKMEAADLEIMEELSDVVAPVNKAVTLLEDFNRRYADWINEAKFQSYRNSLRETATIMLSEFYSLRNGQKEKSYSEDKVCKECHSVFMFPLPENLCDECRSRKTRRNAYDTTEE
ncbi:MAG: hypothetical protein ACFCU1_09020 [Sumerlaeia bacterium]